VAKFKKEYLYTLIAGIFLLYIFTWLFFIVDGFIPIGTIEKQNWLLFWGSFLSFVGTVFLGFVATTQNNWANDMNKRLLQLEEDRMIPLLYIRKAQNIDGKAYIVNTTKRSPVGDVVGFGVKLTICDCKRNIVSSYVEELTVNDKKMHVFECINTDFLEIQSKKFVINLSDEMSLVSEVNFFLRFSLINLNGDNYFQDISFTLLNRIEISNFRITKAIKQPTPND